MTGPGGPYNFTLPPIPEVGDYYGTATPSGFVVSKLAPCAYLVTLTITVLLTDGDNYPDPLYDEIAFCKSNRLPIQGRPEFFWPSLCMSTYFFTR